MKTGLILKAISKALLTQSWSNVLLSSISAEKGAADEASSQEQKDGGEPANVERRSQLHLFKYPMIRTISRLARMKMIIDGVGDPADWYEKKEACNEEGNSRSQSHFAPLPFVWHEVHKISPSHTKQDPKELNDNGNDDKCSGSLHVFR